MDIHTALRKLIIYFQYGLTLAIWPRTIVIIDTPIDSSPRAIKYKRAQKFHLSYAFID